MDKDNTTDVHGPWYELSVGGSVPVNTTCTVITHAVVTTHTCLAK